MITYEPTAPPTEVLPPAPFTEVRIGANDVVLLRDGAQAYPAMLEAIAAASSTICLETYTLRDDRTGRRFAEALCERARAGVQVNLVYDDWGSSVSLEFLGQLRSAGVRVVAFGPVLRRGFMGQILARLRKRNHRKSLVVDGQVAFIGGLNVADDYASTADGGKGWRDTQVRIRGPAALSVERMFLATWRLVRGPPLDQRRYLKAPQEPDPRVRIVSNDFHSDRKDIRKAYVAAIHKAQRRVLLTHAYFVPPSRLMKALQRAASRGVEVSVIVADTTDVALVRLASRSLYGRLLRSGVKVYEWSGRVLHAKTAVVDGVWTTVGSANLDPLSLRANLEVNAVFEDARLGAQAERMFTQDLAGCSPVSLQQWSRRSLIDRILSHLAYQLRNWL